MIKTVKHYVNEEGFEFVHEPIEDSLKIVKTKDGYEARYLVQDNDAQSPEELGDGNLFLVGYHREFTVDRGTKGISQELAKAIANKGITEYGEISEKAKDYIKKYHIFLLDAYIHSGVSLSLHGEGRQCRWDTSTLGLCFASKDEFKTRKQAEKAVRGLIEEWNEYLSGDVYGIVKETYTKDKEQIEHDSCWGFYGYDYAIKSLETEI